MVVRTFSKCYGLAAVRCGFVMADAKWIDYANRVREPFNCNMFAQVAAAAALTDESFVNRSVETNEAGRAQLHAALEDLVEIIPSQTNFLLMKTPVPGVEVYDALLKKGVIVRPLAGYGLHDYIRVTIGTAKQNDAFIKALKAVL